jgi:hypothetical protein
MGELGFDLLAKEPSIRKDEFKIDFDRTLPLDNLITPNERTKDLPILDLFSGIRAGNFMKQYRDQKLILVDRSYFVDGWLNRQKQYYNIGDNVVIRRGNVKNEGEILKENQYRYVRFGNLPEYVTEKPENYIMSEHFMRTLVEKIAPGGSFSYEFYSIGQVRHPFLDQIPLLVKIKQMIANFENWQVTEGVSEKGLGGEHTNYVFFTKSNLPLMKPHAAMTSQREGGINLTPANLNLQTLNAGQAIKFHMDPALFQQLQNAPGFVPVIINIQPMTDLRIFLGLDSKSVSPVSAG